MATGVVVSINKSKSTCQVAVKEGLLHRAYVYHVQKPVPEASNKLEVMNLSEAYEDWRSLPNITEREAARFILSVGGQGVILLELSPKGTYVMYPYHESLEDRVLSHDRYTRYLITANPHM